MKPRTVANGPIALCIGLIASLPASAMPPFPPPDGPMMHSEFVPGGPEPIPPYLQGLELSKEQRDKIFEIMHSQVPALRTKGNEARQAQEEIRWLSLSTNFDETKAKGLADASARAMADVALLRAHADQQIYRLLTPEQRHAMKNRPSDADPDSRRPARR
jgi:periplasmic protein CpxP/Spy